MERHRDREVDTNAERCGETQGRRQIQRWRETQTHRRDGRDKSQREIFKRWTDREKEMERNMERETETDRQRWGWRWKGEAEVGRWGGRTRKQVSGRPESQAPRSLLATSIVSCESIFLALI